MVVVVVVVVVEGMRMTSVTFQINGTQLTLADHEVRTAVRGLAPEQARAHVVEIDGVVLPVKQAFGAATGFDRLDFTTNQARTAFKRLGFTVRRIEDDK